MCRYRNTRRNGSVLAIVLFISGLAAVLGTGMFAVGYQARVRAVRTAQKMAAGVAADAGLTRAIHTLTLQYTSGSLDPDALPAATDTDLPNSEGTFTYAVTEGPSGDYTITSIGSCHTIHRTVEGIIRSEGVVHDCALFVQDDVVLKSFATIDWYNNETGDDPLKIGTNSAGTGKILLYNGAFINGDVIVGSGGDPDSVISNGGAEYTGEAYVQSANRAVPSVSVPADLVSGVSKGEVTGNTTISQSGKYDSINLGNGKTLTIQGNVELYITGDVVLGNSAEIEIEEGASLVLYVDGRVEGKNSSKFNNKTENPRALKLLGTDSCTSVILKNAGDMYSIIYTPEAELSLHNSATVWGSITSQTCELDNSATLYYDASLMDYHDPALVELKLASWREY